MNFAGTWWEEGAVVKLTWEERRAGGLSPDINRTVSLGVHTEALGWEKEIRMEERM